MKCEESVGLNRYFDFTRKQLWFVGFLAAAAVLMATFTFIRSYASSRNEPPKYALVGTAEASEFEGFFRVDVNTAPLDSLELIKYLGPVLSKRIVEYRQEHRIDSLEDLTRIEGIGPATLDKIRPFLKVSPE